MGLMKKRDIADPGQVPRGFISVIAVLALAIADWSLPGLAASPRVGSTSRAYDLASSADRKLMDFDRTHADCEMWSDWHKLCSRMGPSGTTTCRTDPLHSAKPSEPFCAVGEPPSSDTLAEGLSRSRYCVQFMDHPPPHLTEPAGARYCTAYLPARPFGGERIEQVETPDCLGWLSASGVGCTTVESKTGPSSCTGAIMRGSRVIFPYVCTRWSPRVQCSHPVGDAEPERPTYLQGVRVSVQEAPMLRSSPVWGTYCKRPQRQEADGPHN
jgi:hypothetical protein